MIPYSLDNRRSSVCSLADQPDTSNLLLELKALSQTLENQMDELESEVKQVKEAKQKLDEEQAAKESKGGS